MGYDEEVVLSFVTFYFIFPLCVLLELSTLGIQSTTV
jgi:hypothetical protein